VSAEQYKATGEYRLKVRHRERRVTDTITKLIRKFCEGQQRNWQILNWPLCLRMEILLVESSGEPQAVAFQQ